MIFKLKFKEWERISYKKNGHKGIISKRNRRCRALNWKSVSHLRNWEEVREGQQACGQEEACHKMKSRGRQGQNTLDLVGLDKGLGLYSKCNGNSLSIWAGEWHDLIYVLKDYVGLKIDLQSGRPAKRLLK